MEASHTPRLTMFRQSTSEGSSAYQPQRFLDAIRPSHYDLPAEFQQKSARSTCQTLTGISKLFPPEVDHSILAVSRRTSERSSVLSLLSIGILHYFGPMYGLLRRTKWLVARPIASEAGLWVDKSTKIVEVLKDHEPSDHRIPCVFPVDGLTGINTSISHSRIAKTNNTLPRRAHHHPTVSFRQSTSTRLALLEA